MISLENVSKNLVASYYNGTNAEEVLALVRLIKLGNDWNIKEETEAGLTLTESSPTSGLSGDWFFRPYTWVVIEPASGSLERLTDGVFMAQYRGFKDIFLAAASDPAVLQALREALFPELAK